MASCCFLLCFFLTVSAVLQCTCTFQLSKIHPHTRHKHKKDSGRTGVFCFFVMAGKKRVRYAIELVFTSEEERTSFKQRWNDVKTLISPAGGPKLENTPSILKLCKLAEDQGRPAAQTVPQTGSFLQKAGITVSVISMLSLGMFSGNCMDDLFVSEKGCLSELCAGLVCPCPCCASSQWLFSSAVQVTRVYCHCSLSLKFSSFCRKVMFFV